MEVIESVKDQRVARARDLSTRAGRLAAGRCLLEGASLIGQALDAGVTLDYVLHSAEAAEPSLTQALARHGVAIYPVRPGVLAKVTGGSKPVDWLAITRLPDEVTAQAPYGDFAVVCDNVTDPGNLGTIARTARALGVSDLVLTDSVTDLSTRRVLDASRAGVLLCRVRRFPDPTTALDALHRAGFQVVATSPHGTHLQALAPLRANRVALVVGNETTGVSAATLAAADLVVRIPMIGPVESLNVGVAAGISIYELRMKMVLAMLTDRIRATLGRDLNLAGRLVRATLDRRLRDSSDIGADHAIALMILACEHTTPLTELRRDLGLAHDELLHLLTPLAQQGYLTLTPQAAEITTQGEQTIAALWAIQEQTEEELYQDFSPTERDQLRDFLHRIQRRATALLQ